MKEGIIMSKSDKLTHDEFVEKLKNHAEYIEVIGKYINNKTPILVRNKITGKEHTVRPDTIFNTKEPFKTENRKIRETALTEEARLKIITTTPQKHNKTLDDINKKLKERDVDNLYELNFEATKYINNKMSTIVLKCLRCDNEFNISYVNLCAGKGCPICNKLARQESKNVKKIKLILEKYSIPYETEYKINECKHERVLPFDFAFENGKKLLEYDGEFHDNGYNNNKESLSEVHLHDSIKTNFCKENNIPLLRLRYNDFDNFEERIKKFLSV